MPQSSRPTHKELSGKIEQAKRALKAQGSPLLLRHDVLVDDALALGYSIEEDLCELMDAILNEVDPSDYAGNKPPQRSYENEIRGCDLFAFQYYCLYLEAEIYVKFAFDKQKQFWLVSLHQPKK